MNDRRTGTRLKASSLSFSSRNLPSFRSFNVVIVIVVVVYVAIISVVQRCFLHRRCRRRLRRHHFDGSTSCSKSSSMSPSFRSFNIVPSSSSSSSTFPSFRWRNVVIVIVVVVIAYVAVISMVQRRSSMDAYFKKLRCLVKTKNIQRIEKLDEDARTDLEELVLRIKSQRPRRVYHDSHER